MLIKLLAYCAFVPMFCFLLVLAGLQHVANFGVMACVVIADVATPLVMALAKIIDRGNDDV